MLSKKAYYGYEILQELSKYPIIHTKESTIYPLLRRLLKENYLTSFWQETTEEVPSRLKNKKAVKPSIYATFQLFSISFLQQLVGESNPCFRRERATS